MRHTQLYAFVSFKYSIHCLYILNIYVKYSDCLSRVWCFLFFFIFNLIVTFLLVFLSAFSFVLSSSDAGIVNCRVG